MTNDGARSRAEGKAAAAKQRKKELCEVLHALGRAGANDQDLADFMDVRVDRVRDWRDPSKPACHYDTLHQLRLLLAEYRDPTGRVRAAAAAAGVETTADAAPKPVPGATRASVVDGILSLVLALSRDEKTQVLRALLDDVL